MSKFELVALVAASIWLGVITIVLLMMIRQISLLTLRISRTSQAVPIVEDDFSIADDGPQVDSAIPNEATTILPELHRGETILLLVAATCRGCRELAADLSKSHVEFTIMAMVPGPPELADAVVGLLPSGMQVMRDPEATRLADALSIQSTPFAVVLKEGKVTAKSYISNGKADLMELVRNARDQESDASPVLDTIPRR